MNVTGRPDQEGQLEAPIIVVGTGRCGSTALHYALSHHAKVAWWSRVCDRRPHDPGANRWSMHALDLPWPNRYLRKLIYPVEAYRFWEYHCPGFSEPCRDLVQGDVTPRVKGVLRNVLAKTITRRRSRLLLKITGWPRIGFLKETLPNARFIHIYRDGRAVANSLLTTRWWSGWRGPSNWRWGELAPGYRERWHHYDRSFVALAAIEWELLMLAQDKAAQKIDPQDLLAIRYEDLCQDAVGTIRLAAEFSRLDWSPAFEDTVRRLSFENRNDRWLRELSSEQQVVLNECLHEALRRYGYA